MDIIALGNNSSCKHTEGFRVSTKKASSNKILTCKKCELQLSLSVLDITDYKHKQKLAKKQSTRKTFECALQDFGLVILDHNYTLRHPCWQQVLRNPIRYENVITLPSGKRYLEVHDGISPANNVSKVTEKIHPGNCKHLGSRMYTVSRINKRESIVIRCIDCDLYFVCLVKSEQKDSFFTEDFPVDRLSDVLILINNYFIGIV